RAPSFTRRAADNVRSVRGGGSLLGKSRAVALERSRVLRPKVDPRAMPSTLTPPETRRKTRFLHLLTMEFAKLVIAKPGVPPTEVAIGALTSIGRAPGNTIVLDEPHVSRHHTVIRVNEGGTYLISDLGSSNGTYLNARRVLLPERLRHRDVIKIGAVTLTFMHAASERPQAQSAGGDDYTMTGEEPRHE